ncbi:CRTAC1 family protein [Myxosarcina sp. GI1]|uniref:CRTAC1 family protein n=1 Tax=Myxosarcina sp. GI1 TaxID=1541065 RepID=UPI00055BE2CA|nr:CRTAC1 family protein [Myxosarcina sp. GI1]
MAQARFQEVTDIAGISYVGQSHGGAWGDVNNDTLPDLWLSNHYKPDILYLNQGDGTFSDATSKILVKKQAGDTHGAAWADFDNDGDLDLVQLIGAEGGQGVGSNRLYINNGQRLVDRASKLGIDYPLNRGRTPLWLDYDNDGRLDLLVNGQARPDGQAPTTIFRQIDGKFVDVGSTTGLEVVNSSYALLSDLSKDDNLDLLIRKRIYDLTSNPFEDISVDVLRNLSGFVDVASADLNGDLLSDLYIARNTLTPSSLYKDSSNGFRMWLAPGDKKDGVQFKTTGNVTFKLRSFSGNGFNPTSFQFTLSPENPQIPKTVPGIDISYNDNLKRWRLSFSKTKNKGNLTGIVRTTEPISGLTAFGFDNNSLPEEDILLLNSSQGFKYREIYGIPTAAKSVVTGDFDNDMDVDVYIVTSEPAGNQPNVFYENQGDGTFKRDPNAAGAAGSKLGVAGDAMSVDYDSDGFLDLFVNNGQWPPLLYNDGPAQLFQNQGNNNHWLEIDLEGVETNRDGIGAKVFTTAGGVTQLREQTSGMHFRSQNHQRIHFGLGENKIVDELVVNWPSGIEQRIKNIPADQLIRIIEPSGSFSLGQPNYQVGKEEGVFLWQDTLDGTYHLRVNGDNVATNFEIDLIATKGLLKTANVELESNDKLEVNKFGFSLNSQLRNRQDGIDFQLKPGAKALFSVTQNGIANPRQLNVGSESSRLAPAGWIFNSNELTQRPAFESGKDLGLFVGKGANSKTIEFRSSGDGNLHQSALAVFAAKDTAKFLPVGLDNSGEGSDKLIKASNGLEIRGSVGYGNDGLDVITSEPVKMGLAYQQDNLVQPHWINPNHDFLGFPNAYWLPSAIE